MKPLGCSAFFGVVLAATFLAALVVLGLDLVGVGESAAQTTGIVIGCLFILMAYVGSRWAK